MTAFSVKNKETPLDIPPETPDLHLGDKAPDGGQLRPFIVWFGEAVPMIDTAIEYMQQSDIVVVIGTSLNVYPALGLLNYVRLGQSLFLIDSNELHAYRPDITHIKVSVSVGVRTLTEHLKAMNTLFFL